MLVTVVWVDMILDTFVFFVKYDLKLKNWFETWEDHH